MTAHETLFWSLDIIFFFTFCVTILLLRVGMWVESAVRLEKGGKEKRNDTSASRAQGV